MMDSDLNADLDALRFDERGLIPVVAQDAASGEVLMLAWASREAIERTLSTRRGTYFSRSRSELWVKGLTSGHAQEVVGVRFDCDGDAVLYQVRQTGPACHTGERSCFHGVLMENESEELDPVLGRVYAIIQERLETLPPNSYVARLHAGGLDRVLKKIAEEAGEVLLAAKNGDKAELATEAADLFFHTLFALAEVGVTPGDVARILAGREGKSGLKGPKEVG